MMNKLRYLSPTSLSLYLNNKEEFFKRYLSDNKPPREPQTQPMSIGSAFDAYVKNYLHESLYGKGVNVKFDLLTLFEMQVEDQHRKWAWDNGKYVFEQYKSAGTLADLMLELNKAQGEPRFEIEVMGTISGYIDNQIKDVPFLGKPDVSFVTNEGVHIVLDFKVNGYCSKYNISPAQGYVRMRSAGRTNFGCHKDCFPIMENGIIINAAQTLDMIKSDWAQQLSIYAWLCGEPVGSEFISAIDQIVCKNSGSGLPAIRVAEHRGKIAKTFQEDVFRKAWEAWDIINSDWFFRDMEKEDSVERCKMLNSDSDDVNDAESFLRTLR